MTPHLHRLLSLRSGDTVKVNLKGAANVMLMDDDNYDRFSHGEHFDFYGKTVKRSPCLIPVPGSGEWHLVIEQTDLQKDVTAHVQIVRPAR